MGRIVFLLIFLLHGCDLFSTREPEVPTQGSSGFKPPVTADIVIDNFKSSITEYNADNYLRCFVDTTASARRFTFSASGDFFGLFARWGLEEERRYFENLGQPLSQVPVLEFSDMREENRTSVSTEYTMNYLFFFPHQRAGITKQVRGYMHLYLALDNQQRWAIYQWDDRRTASDSTWSYLKYYAY